MTKDEALKMAIDLLETLKTGKENPTQSNIHIVCNICEEALEQPAPSCQECENLKHDLEGYMDANKELINREWVGLSDDEIEEIVDCPVDVLYSGDYEIYRAIEQALRERNCNDTK